MTRSLSLVLLALIPGTAMAVDAVEGTKHDLSTGGGGTYKLSGVTPAAGTEQDQICVFCHTPHGANTGPEVVLWNRATNTAGYTMYDSATIQMSIAAQPQTVSQACLSCHDGSIAFDRLYNGPGTGDYDATAASRGWTFSGANSLSGAGVTKLGMDLSNDHPTSVDYDITLDTAFNTALSVTTAGLRFYCPPGSPGCASPDQVECGTCHNPHDATTAAPFLRMANTDSNLCLTCHLK